MEMLTAAVVMETLRIEHKTPVFEFRQSAVITKATGKRARNLRELREVIAVINSSSLASHTLGYFIKGHSLHYTNDFAEWAGQSLEERALAEHLSVIDPYDYTDMEELRAILIGAIDRYLAEFPEPRDVFPGKEFYFHENVVISFPSEVRAANLAEFLMAIKYVDFESLYYHFYDARTRLGGRNDFSVWMAEGLGKTALAEKIALIDPFMHQIDSIRGQLAQLVEEEVKRDMEVMP